MEEVLYRFNPWWENKKFAALVDRPHHVDDILESFDQNTIVLLTGLRRVGKTSLLRLAIQRLIGKHAVDPKRILYVSLDDYNLMESSIIDIIESFRKIHDLSYTDRVYVFLDEVTYKQDFEIQLKNLYDSQTVKVFASASSASILKDRKQYITGRNRVLEVLPLDFQEYLDFKNISIGRSDRHLLEKEFDAYLKSGGIPEYVLFGQPAYIHELVDDIIMKDIAAINNIRQPRVLKDFFMLMMERAGKQVSLGKIGSILGIASDTAARYLEMFERAYLVNTVQRHGKTNERLLSPRKIYAPDTGIRNYYTGFRDKGSLFENYVFLRLKRYDPEYMYQDQTELDFVLDNGIVVEAKYHDEPLSDKQSKLFETFDKQKRFVVRNYDALRGLIEKIERG